jgi:hypothetical protein
MANKAPRVTVSDRPTEKREDGAPQVLEEHELERRRQVLGHHAVLQRARDPVQQEGRDQEDLPQELPFDTGAALVVSVFGLQGTNEGCGVRIGCSGIGRFVGLEAMSTCMRTCAGGRCLIGPLLKACRSVWAVQVRIVCLSTARGWFSPHVGLHNNLISI